MEVRPQSQHYHSSNFADPPTADQKKGALIIIDSFHASDAHGFHVEGAARSLGETGPIYRYNQLKTVDGKLTMPHVEALESLREPMTSSVLSPKQARTRLKGFLETAVSKNLNLATTLLKEVTAEGFQNSAVNFSQGLDPITYFKIIKSPLGDRELSDQQKQTYFYNLNSAVSPNPKAPPTVGEFDNLLLQTIKRTIKDSTSIGEARDGWREQVRTFESNQNSVVIAAGNSGQEMKAMAKAGFDVDGSEDVNIFAVPEVTTVAASATTENGGIFLASPSSFGEEVDFLASGFHGEQFGSSFASPKVANIMRAAHAANPSADSEQIEEWAKTEVSVTGEIKEHEVAILNTKWASSLLQPQEPG